MATKRKLTGKKNKQGINTRASKKSGGKKRVVAKAVASVAQSSVDKAQISAARKGVGIQHYAWRRDHYRTLQEFWPFYLHEHSSARNRMLHFAGSTIGLIIFAVAMVMSNYLLIVPALVSGYAFAWFGHFFIEKNRPATFKYPVKSFVSDWRMWYCMLTGRIISELKKFGIESRQ